MESRAAKRKANQPLTKRRVVLGELSNLPNLIAPQPAVTDKTLTVNNDVSAESNVTAPIVSNIYNYLRTIEMEKRRPMVDYIENVQKGGTTIMRGILVDWIVEVAEEYKLLSNTIFLCVSYIDTVLSINPVSKPRLQLLCISSMFIASKYEETSPPDVEDFSALSLKTRMTRQRW